MNTLYTFWQTDKSDTGDNTGHEQIFISNQKAWYSWKGAYFAIKLSNFDIFLKLIWKVNLQNTLYTTVIYDSYHCFCFQLEKQFTDFHSRRKSVKTMPESEIYRVFEEVCDGEILDRLVLCKNHFQFFMTCCLNKLYAGFQILEIPSSMACIWGFSVKLCWLSLHW